MGWQQAPMNACAKTACAPPRWIAAMPGFLASLPRRLHELLAGLRRWLTYRPERRFMRG